jgi:hypothetical protein
LALSDNGLAETEAEKNELPQMNGMNADLTKECPIRVQHPKTVQGLMNADRLSQKDAKRNRCQSGSPIGFGGRMFGE